MSDIVLPDPMTIPIGDGERRQPVYFLLDTSEGAIGAPLETMRRGVEQFLLEIQGDTFALETVWVGIITFGGRAEYVTSGLVPFRQLVMPSLTAGGQNVLCEALRLLSQSLDRDIRLPTRGGAKGDWRPLVLIFLASTPVGAWRASWEEIIKRKRPKIRRVAAVGCAPNVDLEDIAIGVPFSLGSQGASFKAWFEWDTALEEPSTEIHEQVIASITAEPSIIDLGCLLPGTGPCTKVRIEGGPARATTDSQRIVVTPSEIGEEPTEIEVTITDGSDGELIWGTLHIRGDSGELDVPVICMWDEALSRSFKQSSRRATRRKVAQPAEPEEQMGATDVYPDEDMDKTEPAELVLPTEPLAGDQIERTYTGRSCPHCRKNLRYDSDSRAWLTCSKCTGARRLISVPERVVSETRMGIKNDGKKILRDLWEVITGRQDWNLR